MKAWDSVPGVPAAGHVTSGGHWHSGDRKTCAKCKRRDELTRKGRQPLLPKDHRKEASMTLCRTKLIVEGVREWEIGGCDREAGHEPPHYLVTQDVRGRTVQITWRDDEEGITVSSTDSSS